MLEFYSCIETILIVVLAILGIVLKFMYEKERDTKEMLLDVLEDLHNKNKYEDLVN